MFVDHLFVTRTERFPQIIISYLRTKRESLEKTKRAIVAAAYQVSAASHLDSQTYQPREHPQANLSAKPPLFYHQVPEAATSSETPLYSVLPFSPVTTSSVSADDKPTFRIERANGPIGSPVDKLAPVVGDISLGSLSGVDP